MSKRYKFSDPPKAWQQSRGLFPEPDNFWPQLMLWEIDNVRAVVAESQLFLYVKLATGVHPRALEQIVHRRYMSIEPTVENTFAMNFLQLSLEMLKNLQRGAACKGLCSLEEYKALISNPTAHFEFRADMRRRFPSMLEIVEQSLSPDLYQEIADSPLLSDALITHLCATLGETENWIRLQVDLAEAQMATDAPELYLETHASRATQWNPFAGVPTPNTLISQYPSLASPAPPSAVPGEATEPTDSDPSDVKPNIEEQLQYTALAKRLPSLHPKSPTPEPDTDWSFSPASDSFNDPGNLRGASNTTGQSTGDLKTTLKPVNRVLDFSPDEHHQAYSDYDSRVLPLRRGRRSTRGDIDRYDSQDEIETDVEENNDNQPEWEYQQNMTASPKRRRVAPHLRIPILPPRQTFDEKKVKMEEDEADGEDIW